MKLEHIGQALYCPDDPGEPGLGKKRWSVSQADERVLAELFRNLIVLEIGTGLGISTKAIASTAKHVHTVDIDPWVKEHTPIPDNATFYHNIDDVPKLLDGAFIDGLHSFDQCVKDIENARKIVKKGGLLVFHDSKMNQVRKAIVASKIAAYEITTEAGIGFGWND